MIIDIQTLSKNFCWATGSPIGLGRLSCLISASMEIDKWRRLPAWVSLLLVFCGFVDWSQTQLLDLPSVFCSGIASSGYTCFSPTSSDCMCRLPLDLEWPSKPSWNWKQWRTFSSPRGWHEEWVNPHKTSNGRLQSAKDQLSCPMWKRFPYIFPMLGMCLPTMP